MIAGLRDYGTTRRKGRGQGSVIVTRNLLVALREAPKRTRRAMALLLAGFGLKLS